MVIPYLITPVSDAHAMVEHEQFFRPKKAISVLFPSTSKIPFGIVFHCKKCALFCRMAARPTFASCGPSRRRSRAGGPSRRRCSSGRARTAMFRSNDCPPVKLSHKLFSTRLAFVINAVSRVDHSAPAGRVRAGYVSPFISRAWVMSHVVCVVSRASSPSVDDSGS